MKIQVLADLNMHDVAESLSWEDALTLIKLTDEVQADWDFTKMVVKHFAEQLEASGQG